MNTEEKPVGIAYANDRVEAEMIRGFVDADDISEAPGRRSI